MNSLNINKEKREILFFGVFLILIIEALIDISLFIAKLFSVYLFNNLHIVPYLFFLFTIMIFYLEFLFLWRKGNFFTFLNFKKISLSILVLYTLSFAIPYFEGSVVLPYVAENYSQEDSLYFHLSFRYSNTMFILHNLLLIIYAIIKISRRSR